MSAGTLEKEKVKSMFCEKVDRANVVVDDEYKNHISSSKPAYMHKGAMEKLEQSVGDTAEALEGGRIDSQALEFTRRKLARERKRLHDIKEQTPVYTPVEMQHISSTRKDLDVEISNALFTKSDMEKGLVDPSKEADRMSLPCIKVDRKLAAMCDVELTDGKCSRSEAEGIRKMALWHETGGTVPAYTEELRRDHGGHAKKSSQVSVGIDLNEMERVRLLEEKIAKLEAMVDVKVAAETIEKKETYTCPDCNEEVAEKGRAIHDSRWCKVKNKKE